MSDYPPVSPYVVGFTDKCPRCAQGPLFESFLGLRKNCERCGLDFAQADAGDGPAVFVIFIVGFIAVAAAFIFKFAWYAPLWLAFAISAVLAIGLTLALLRPLKATLIALQYANKAAEGRPDD